MSVKIAHPAASHGISLQGRITVPGDKSISHRSLILGALSVGESTIHGLLEGADVLATARALRAFGAEISRGINGVWHINGVGVGGLMAPSDILDLGNSGTGARLLLGLAATHGITSVFTGDASLRQRPMERVITPLQQMGARFEASGGGRLPITVIGTNRALPIEYRLPVASAQIKSAVLLAGLNAPGCTAVIEPRPSRDHTEHLLRHFGAEVTIGNDGDGARRITLTGRPELQPQTVRVPGDPSSAAFPIAAALLVPGSEVAVTGVGLNPLRAALLDTLRDMGAQITEHNRRQDQGEPIADLIVRAGPLRGIEVPSERAPAMIDEYPILAAVAAFASGRTVMRGISELRVKESDRISAMANGLGALGVQVEELADGLIVHGHDGAAPIRNCVSINTEMDHRIAMSFLVYGLAAQGPVRVTGCEMIDTSFPGFVELMTGLGARIEDAP
ncbi:MAG: 3-phosphoshikimate 1-carboxyvinyltransferase [Proteobacteria bacterium]|nr:3-phosphoshikimate 1-carboxyvinyltransferase [Pseudomonadota bacterium]